MIYKQQQNILYSIFQFLNYKINSKNSKLIMNNRHKQKQLNTSANKQNLNKKQPTSHQQSPIQKSQTIKVSSLTQQCLTNLRKGSSTQKTHLLGFMSQYIQDQQQIKLQQVDQLCCYDRMKKLLIKNQNNKQEKKQQQITLFKAMQIQSKMNLLQKDLQQKIYNKNNTIKNSSIHNRNKTDIKCKTQHFSFKNNMLDNLKQKGYQKFFEFQKIKKQTNLNKIKQIIGQQVQSKFKKVVNQKDLQKRKLIDQNRLLQRRILQKNVQLQTLRSQNVYLKDYVKQMQQKLFGANNQLQNAHLISSYQKWLSQYKQHFGQMSIKQLHNYIDNIKTKCLQKFDIVQNKNQLKLLQLIQLNQDKNIKYKKQMEKLQKRQNQLIQINKNLKLNKQISQLQINQLQRAKQELVVLRQLILSLYSQWYQKRTQNQKSLLKNFNKLKQNYSYQDMLKYAVFYQNKLSTNDKLNDYILKILRGIQKIRRIIFPMQSNQKLDPFIVLDKIQTWVQKRVKQKGPNDYAQRITKTKLAIKDKQHQQIYMNQ